VDGLSRPGYGVAAAGGVVWRDAGRAQVEVAIAYRNRYDDWTLPKGRLKPVRGSRCNDGWAGADTASGASRSQSRSG
jgi:hypothetical protein